MRWAIKFSFQTEKPRANAATEPGMDTKNGSGCPYRALLVFSSRNIEDDNIAATKPVLTFPRRNVNLSRSPNTSVKYEDISAISRLTVEARCQAR